MPKKNNVKEEVRVKEYKVDPEKLHKELANIMYQVSPEKRVDARVGELLDKPMKEVNKMFEKFAKDQESVTFLDAVAFSKMYKLLKSNGAFELSEIKA